MDALEVSFAAVSAMPRGCHEFSRNDPPIMLSSIVLGSGHLYISAKDVHHFGSKYASSHCRDYIYYALHDLYCRIKPVLR